MMTHNAIAAERVANRIADVREELEDMDPYAEDYEETREHLARLQEEYADMPKPSQAWLNGF